MIIVATVGVLVAVGLSALRLGGITTDLTSIRTSSDTVASSNREALLLEQMVTALGETTDGRAVAVQAGLLQRQLIVSIAAFPPDAAPPVSCAPSSRCWPPSRGTSCPPRAVTTIPGGCPHSAS